MRDEDEADGPATPRVTGSYALFRDECQRVAKLLDQAVLVTRKRIDLYDEDRIRRGEHLSAELRELARRFHRWPSLGAEAVARERLELMPELKRLLRSTKELLEAMPTAGTLGRVRRPPGR